MLLALSLVTLAAAVVNDCPARPGRDASALERDLVMLERAETRERVSQATLDKAVAEVQFCLWWVAASGEEAWPTLVCRSASCVARAANAKAAVAELPPENVDGQFFGGMLDLVAGHRAPIRSFINDHPSHRWRAEALFWLAEADSLGCGGFDVSRHWSHASALPATRAADELQDATVR